MRQVDTIFRAENEHKALSKIILLNMILAYYSATLFTK